MIYLINEKKIEVLNEITEYDELIYQRFSQFKCLENVKTNNYIKFNKNTVEINIESNLIYMKNKIEKTDIYPIINNVISYCINDSTNIYMHSVVVSKNGKGFLLLGTFGQGKTTLANQFLKKGYEINSTDQTWLTLENNLLISKLGSRFEIIENKITLLSSEYTNKQIEIKKIIRIVGLCDNGDVSYKEIIKKEHFVKNLIQFSNWSYEMPLFTEYKKLYNSQKNIFDFLKDLSKSNIRYMDIRGDKNKIVDIMEG